MSTDPYWNRIREEQAMTELIADSSAEDIDTADQGNPSPVGELLAVPAELPALSRSFEGIAPSLRGRPGPRGCGGSGI